MKLLNRTLLRFLVYSIAVLVIVTPVLYFIINNIIIDKVDETLHLHKEEIEKRLELLPTEDDVRRWEDLDGEVFVTPIDRPIEEKLYTTGDRRILITSSKIKGNLYQLEARISLVESDDLISALVFTQVVVLVALIAGMLIINWWNSRTVWKPFYDTLNKLRSFNIEKNSPLLLEPSTISEFRDLNVAIEELTRRSIQAFVSQREFTENAAHEMQTPLAVFQSKLDILLQTQPSMEQASVIDSLYEATRRLNRLNKGLLLLTRIENSQYSESESVDLFAATERHIRDTTIALEGRKTAIVMNPELLDILLSNLVSNALRYSSGRSQISISIDDESWTIKNPGAPLSISPEKIFHRFQKGSANKDSLGLGLAIAKRICDVSNLQISYSFENDLHSFTIRIPASKKSPKS